MDFFKKIKKKVKSSDSDESAVQLPSTTSNTPDITSKNDEVESQSTSSVLSDRMSEPEEQSPEHGPVSMTNSLFSGMVLSNTAIKQEDDSSPYLQRRLDIKEESTFSFLNENTDECVSDTNQLGFSFIKAKKDTVSDTSVEQLSPFGFITQSPDPDVSTANSSSFSFISDKDISSNVNIDSSSNSMSTEANSEIPSIALTYSSSTQRQSKVNRQAPPSSNKKKKHKALRPGQERQESHSTIQKDTTLSASDDKSADLLIITNSEQVSNKSIEETTTEVIDKQIEETSTEMTYKPIEETFTGRIDKPGEDTSTEVIDKPIEETPTEVIDKPIEETPTEVIDKPIEETSFVNSMNSSVHTTMEDASDKTANSENLAEKLVDENLSLSTPLQNALDDHTCAHNHSTLSSTNDDITKRAFSDNLIRDLTCDNANDTGTSDNDIPKVLEIEEIYLKSKFETDRLHNNYGSKIEKMTSSLKLRISKKENIQDLKLKEEAALAKENYELAEELRQELESLEASEDIHLMMDCHTIVKEWLDECTVLMDNELLQSEQVLNRLTELEDEHSKELQLFDKDFSLNHAKMKIDLQAMADKVEKEKGHIALDREHLEKKQQILKDEVTERAAEFIAKKKQLEKDQEDIDYEIQILEEKLKKLKERKEELVKLISEEDHKIQSVHDELSSNQEQLEKEEIALKNSEDELQEHLERLEELQMNYDTAKNEHNKSKQKLISVIDDYKNKRNEINERNCHLQEAQSEAHQCEINSLSHYLHQSDMLKSLLADEKIKDNEMKEMTSKVLVCQSKLSSLQKDINSSEAQISKLQESKKSAVAARHYREASKLASEEKEHLAKLETYKHQLNAESTELSTQNALLKELDEELQKLRQEREQLEKEEDIQNIQNLVSVLSVQKSQLLKFSEETPLYMILKQWTNIHMLLIQDICGKHDLAVNDYITDYGTSTYVKTCVEESIESNGETIKDDLSNNSEETVDSLKAKISNLELRIAQACEEENFDVAAELDEELHLLNSKLSSLQ